MNIAIRTDSSRDIGSGHLMRCLTLADSLRQTGALVKFVCRDLPGNLFELIREKDFILHSLTGNISDQQTDAEQTQKVLGKSTVYDWIIVDHYGLDESWHSLMRPNARKLMVIDDMADRQHDCDLLLDQNLYEKHETRYDKLIPDHCRKLLGPQFALLRDQFRESREATQSRKGPVRKLLICFGASDPTGETIKALEAVRRLSHPDLAVDVVIGSSNRHREEIQSVCDSLNRTRLHIQIKNMAQLMASADLAIGAVGSTTWERCCLGLPALFLSTSDNETELARSYSSLDIGLYLGRHTEVSAEAIHLELREVLEKSDLIQHWSKKAASLVDGRGTNRVYQVIAEYAGIEVRL